ncbi:TetR family transcriptional regulator [Chitinophaga niastensis]|uniref:TetR family transcriptional regulator n=1 Tax=Chitinophaga niastensis TaxID=536980 RepID=A0A2P8HK64_CHINA|nr:TetR/AcrR family transcriptional regulator [Chitinophaga niastensis]PSL46612.1 TetR family transcriptional regulator [Chitinophaga niastensis]
MKEQGAKERIISTACDLFYKQGYQATGINQIIEEAGIAKASLYQHFPSKEALLNEYLLITRLNNYEHLLQFTAKMHPGKQKLMGLFECRLERMETSNFKGCAFIRIAYELPGLNQEATAQVHAHTQGLKTFIEEQLLVIKHSFPKGELREMTDMLLNLYEGAGLQGYIQRSVKPMEDTKKVVRKLIATL